MNQLYYPSYIYLNNFISPKYAPSFTTEYSTVLSVVNDIIESCRTRHLMFMVNLTSLYTVKLVHTTPHLCEY